MGKSETVLEVTIEGRVKKRSNVKVKTNKEMDYTLN